MMRNRQLYDSLLYRDREYRLRPAIAEWAEPATDGMSWTVRIRDGITFHDGRQVRPEDVIFSYRRITDPKNPRQAASLLTSVDRDQMVKVDARTLRIPMKSPDASLREVFADYRAPILPEGYDPKRPVGTGPFKFVSFTPGVESVFGRFGDYWRDGQPYVDEVRILNFTDDTARVNALLAGQVEAIESLPYGQVRVVEADPTFAVLVSKSGNWNPFTMRVDVQPFDDVRVRQAIRLCVDREQMVRQVLSGYGRPANDLYSPFDTCFADGLPQRSHDPDRARSLLRAAGREGLQVELVTSPVSAGVVEAAQVLQQQARQAGMRIDVRRIDTGAFYGDNYLKWHFAQDFWSTWPFLVQAAQGSMPYSPFNECHWDNEEFVRLVEAAKRTLDDEKRCDYIRQAQRIEWDRGGYIVWGYIDLVDAYSRRITGLEENRTGLPLDGYGLRHVWFV